MFDTNNMEDRWGHQWRASQKYRCRLTLSCIEEKLKDRNKQKILDIGCGFGDFTYVVYNFNSSNILFGVDISENAVKGARKKYPQINFKHGVLPEIPFREKFDAIIALECIYYLGKQDRKKAFENISEALNTNGWFLFSSPLDNGVRYFSQIEAIKSVQKTGFEIKKVIYSHAKLYTVFEKKLLFFLNLRNIVEELPSLRELTNVPLRKRLIKKLLDFPVLNGIFLKGVILIAGIAKKILSQLWIVDIFQFSARILLKNKSKSQIIILAERKTI